MEDICSKVQIGCSDISIDECGDLGQAFVAESIPVDRDHAQPCWTSGGRGARLCFFPPYITDSLQTFKQVSSTDRSEQVVTEFKLQGSFLHSTKNLFRYQGGRLR